MDISNKIVISSFDRTEDGSEFSESLGEMDELEALFDASTVTGGDDLKIEREESLQSWHSSYDKVLKSGEIILKT
jgi:hypothetical protein